MRRGKRRYRSVSAAIAGLALIVGFLLIPRQDEYVAMLARDGHYEEALRMLISIREVGRRGPDVLIQSLALHIKLGDVAGALEAVETVLSVRPQDRRAQEIKADLLLQSGRLDEHLRVRDRLIRGQPDPDELSHLLALYRHNGRYEDELDLLQTFAGSGNLKPSEYERLGALLSARGDWEGAARWLRVVDRRAPAIESSARFRLLHVLLQSGRIDEAQRLAELWLSRWRNPYLAGKVILRFAQAGAERTAVDLALLCAERMPHTTFQLAGSLIERSHIGVAREFLARWIDGVREPSAEAARSYVHASLAAGERRKPLEKMLQLVRAGARAEVQANFAEEIAYAYGPELLVQLMPALAQNALRARPLLATQIALSAENRQLAEWYLDRVDPSDLARHKQKLWLTLLYQLKPAPLVLKRLLELRQRGRIPPELVGILAEEARTAGSAELHELAWAVLVR